jgi:hypothetical protein
VLWDEFTPGTSRVSFRRVGTDGTLRTRRRRIYPSGGLSLPIEPRIACVPGSCLVAWQDGPAGVAYFGKYQPAHVVGQRIAGGRLVDRNPLRLLDDIDALADLESDGTGYAVLGWRQSFCFAADLPFLECGQSVIGTTVTGTAVPGSLSGTRLDVGPALGNESAFPTSIGFDGTNWLGTFLSDGRIYGARMSPGRVRLDDEPTGLLLEPSSGTTAATILPTRNDALVVWKAGTTAAASVRRTLAHVPAPALAAVAIGAIGVRSVAERSVPAFTGSTPGLDPGRRP